MHFRFSSNFSTPSKPLEVLQCFRNVCSRFIATLGSLWCSLVSETELVCQQHLPAFRCYSHMSTFTKKEMKTQFLHVLPKANEEFIAQHGLKPQNTSCTTPVFSTDFFCLCWLHQALLHIEGKTSFEALDLLVFTPIKCPEIAPVLILTISCYIAKPVFCLFL